MNISCKYLIGFDMESTKQSEEKGPVWKRKKGNRGTKSEEILCMICKFSVYMSAGLFRSLFFLLARFYSLISIHTIRRFRVFHTFAKIERFLILLRNLYCFSEEIGLCSPFSPKPNFFLSFCLNLFFRHRIRNNGYTTTFKFRWYKKVSHTK